MVTPFCWARDAPHATCHDPAYGRDLGTINRAVRNYASRLSVNLLQIDHLASADRVGHQQ